MKDNICRVVKIDKEALFEFIYESFNAHHDDILDISAVECINNFAIDWNKGTFIFAAYKGEDSAGNIIPFPEDIDINKVLEKIPTTTDSALSPGKAYRDYSFDELRKIVNENS